MMKVEFVLRYPGQHRVLPIIELSSVPRVGEWVSLEGETVMEVHCVTYDIPRRVVSVLLKQ